MRPDGRCANPECKDGRNGKRRRRLPPRALAHGDPYCSTECCRMDLGVVFDFDRTTPRGTAARKKNKTAIRKGRKR